ncbi:PREDICTED: uncharacterized protein LOC107330630 [Acropora digitifera]|uniref:uncharacterized protein LOC107330630 n=1 Tax=Acropora digitifera TaxID=70779 RepID=UPI00077A58AD|nr:PREDICTED: uncharacterized protein LOC107330630 [Acropora digitifera]XP_015750698.1 PREDICTED: uncharacterized protein LOC107330630 [Acropora digitifera]XP_015750703.1 PREDICTED: uncharacterized protein LOC107330630 [Acropora digitifera]XP_015750711.1 PREDICTED: uncharacterized protein LOC107330630 [Acropora digitifera]
MADLSLANSVEKTNGAKLSRLLIDGGTTVLRNEFDKHHPPATLAADLNASYSILNDLLRRRVLNNHQWNKLFPPGGTPPDSSTFDITLLFLLLINICGLSPPSTGWHKEPTPSDTSLEANLARIKFFRNHLYGHVATTGVDTPTFNALWMEISAALVALGLSQAEIDRLKAERCGEEDYVGALLDWAKSEEDIKTQLKDILQIQTRTLEAVVENKSRIEDVHQVVTEIRQSQLHTDQEDEILKKLAKVETQRDVTDYATRYLQGTRESFFAKVKAWLDDLSSPNRVMVISGNAGMGKSVLAAKMCRRMKETGRLSGSHFCHHDKARHRNPKVMLQSLAFHLSCNLPEYKKALVEQLCRNVGVEINDLEVGDLFELLFEEPLSRVTEPGFISLVVLDALDESEFQGRNDLLDVIAKHFKKLPHWLRFLVTTRPEISIFDRLKDLKPLLLEPDDEENLQDIILYFERNLAGLFGAENREMVLKDLVEKSEGVFLCAQFLVDFIKTNCSTLTLEELEKTLPSGISSVYECYFQRLEKDLRKMDISRDQLLSLLCAVVASREPLPRGFVWKLLFSKSLPFPGNVHRAICVISSLLPVQDDCIHFFHKSVRDWLTDKSHYRQHNFSVDEIKGHHILSTLCIEEFDELKRKGVDISQPFSHTTMYALLHGVQHMLQLDQGTRSCSLEEMVDKYVLDIELVYAKFCVISSEASEDIVSVKRQEDWKVLSTDKQRTLESLLFLLKKFNLTLHEFPITIFQTLLNEGKGELSSKALQLLKTKFSDVSYMKFLQKSDLRGAHQTEFLCSSSVVCFDVSPRQDYMVCECLDGSIQLWSLDSGNLKWKRFAGLRKSFVFRKVVDPCPHLNQPNPIESLYRSVVFHPSKNVILPGILSKCFTFNGDQKSLFPSSMCKFHVCSISGDEIFTDCLDDAKCLIAWSLNDGREITRVIRNENIVSFALSRDGKLLAISHSSGCVCLVDRENGFTTLAQTALEIVSGVIRFTEDSRFLYRGGLLTSYIGSLRQLCVTVDTQRNFSLGVTDVSLKRLESECHSFGGFLLGDPLSSEELGLASDFVLNRQSLLRNWYCSSVIVMRYRNKVTESVDGKHLAVESLAFSSTGETIYMILSSTVSINRVMAWEVANWKLKAEKEFSIGSFEKCGHVLAVSGGVLIATSCTLELWNFELSRCIRQWSLDVKSMFSISDDQALCTTFSSAEEIIVDTVTGHIMSTFAVSSYKSIACYRNLHLLASTDAGCIKLQQLGESVPRWELSLLCPHFCRALGCFSPKGQFIVVASFFFGTCAYVLDVFSGNVRFELSDFVHIYDFEFISDEEFVILSCYYTRGASLQLFSVTSGDILGVLPVDFSGDLLSLVSPFSDECFFLATCPGEGLIAICSSCKCDLKVIKAKLSERGNASGNAKRFKFL